MKKIKFFFLNIFLFIILFNCNCVLAKDVTVDEVISYMNQNSIFDDHDFEDLFGDMFNGENEYDISKISYEATKDGEDPLNYNLKVKVVLDDTKTDKIEKEFIFTVKDNTTISYQNTYDIKSLESRVVTFLFDEIIYSVGGARGYNKDFLVEWMNQIDLHTVTLEEGVECTFDSVFYTTNKNGIDYEYELSIPKNFTININAITNVIPETIGAEILEVEPGYTDITMKIFVKEHTSEKCNIYRREEDDIEYKKIGEVRCNDEKFVDTDVEPGKTYYYQASIDGIIMCSEEAKASLLELPLTGAFISIGSIVLLIIIEVIIVITYKKFKKVNSI